MGCYEDMHSDDITQVCAGGACLNVSEVNHVFCRTTKVLEGPLPTIVLCPVDLVLDFHIDERWLLL